MEQTHCTNASFKLGSPLHRASMITKHCEATVPTISIARHSASLDLTTLTPPHSPMLKGLEKQKEKKKQISNSTHKLKQTFVSEI